MTIHRAYSTLTFKAVDADDEDKRIIRGIASTPEPDRLGDIVEPEGAEFKLPLPLLWHHKANEPIGHVTDVKVTKKGIEIVAQIAKVADAGKLKDRIDEAWQTLKAGLVQGLSIGFKALESEPIVDEKTKDDPWAAIFGPKRFIKWLWLELSAVTIPAHGGASITQIKALDRAALGKDGVVHLGKTLPGDSGQSKKVESKMKTIAEQIAALEAKREEKQKLMEEILQKCVEEERSTNEEEREAFDNLAAEVATIDDDLKRFKAMQQVMADKATPVQGKTAQTAAVSRHPGAVVVKANKVQPGIRMARIIRCLGLAQGNRWGACEIAKQIYAHDPVIADTLKANVVAGSTLTTTGQWGAELVSDESGPFADFVEFLRPETIIGKFGQNGIPALRVVPFRTGLIGQSSGGQGYWVGEGKPKPLTSFDFTRRTLTPLKVAAITVATMELLRDSRPSAEVILRDQLVEACRERIDIDFINPDKAAVAGVSPASIINGVAAVGASVGTDADSIRADVRAIFAAFIAANNRASSSVWIMSENTALALSMINNPLGQREFPDITAEGGTFFGRPVITSQYVTQGTTGDFVALVNASDIYFADEGEFQVDMSTEASLQMLDNPTNDVVTPTPTTQVSMFQTNSAAFRAERTLNWMRRRDSAVAWLTGVAWGETVTGP